MSCVNLLYDVQFLREFMKFNLGLMQSSCCTGPLRAKIESYQQRFVWTPNTKFDRNTSISFSCSTWRRIYWPP